MNAPQPLLSERVFQAERVFGWDLAVRHVCGGGADTPKLPLVFIRFVGFRTSDRVRGSMGYRVGWLVASGHVGPDVREHFAGLCWRCT
jgi:hypothetical protein